MKRQKLSEKRRWFALDRAKCFPDRVWFESMWGAWRSRATGSLYAREALYLTASGRWVLCCWSLLQGREPLWVEIPPSAALRWLERVGYKDIADELRKPPQRRGIVYEAVPALECARLQAFEEAWSEGKGGEQ